MYKNSESKKKIGIQPQPKKEMNEEHRGLSTFSLLPPVTKQTRKYNGIVGWECYEYKGKYIFGANTYSDTSSIGSPLQKIFWDKKFKGKGKQNVIILSGSHGAWNGNNWSSTGYRRPELLDKKLFETDERIHKNDPTLPTLDIKVVDVSTLNVKDIFNYYSDPRVHVINSYCFGFYDDVLRAFIMKANKDDPEQHAALPRSISYVDPEFEERLRRNLRVRAEVVNKNWPQF